MAVQDVTAATHPNLPAYVALKGINLPVCLEG